MSHQDEAGSTERARKMRSLNDFGRPWRAGAVWTAICGSSGMTLPRPVVPGKTYMVTRRCTQRQFLLVPCGDVNEVVRFALAVGTKRFGVRLHAACVMSSHYHFVLTDETGNLPRFMQWLNSVVARALNSFHQRSENFWSSDQYSRVELARADDVLRKLVYTYSNPVAAGLVRRARDWPGVMTRPLYRGTYQERVPRPKCFFNSKEYPDEAVLVVSVPPQLEHEDSRLVGRRLFDALREREREIGEGMRQEGRRFLGARVVLRQMSGAVGSIERREAKAQPSFGMPRPMATTRADSSLSGLARQLLRGAGSAATRGQSRHLSLWHLVVVPVRRGGLGSRLSRWSHARRHS